jgi:glyoxylase-like metal-dependent hydrolase (beta-lactamase superfamily II)
VERHSDRRDFIEVLLGAAAGLSLTANAFGQSAVHAEKLSDSVAMLLGAGSNVIALSGAEGLLLIDGGFAERSSALEQALRTLSATLPVKVLFNTHWHPEQTGYNATAAKAGAKILAHEFTRQYLGIDARLEWANRTVQPLPKSAQPNQTFRTKGTLDFGGETIEYGPLGQAHTDGDIFLFLRRANILATGDVISVGRYPILDYNSNGWIRGMATAIKTLIDMSNVQTRVVAAQGAVTDRTYMEKQREMLTTISDRMVKMMRMGYSVPEMLAAGVTKGYEEWGDPELFVRHAYQGLWMHFRELGGAA